MTQSSNADAAAIALATIPGTEGIDNGVLKKLEDLELQIMFRSYYFQGGLPKKFVFGKGTDTDLIHYDGLTEERDMFGVWNPRYLDDYIEQAKQYGFHTHFLYYDGTSIEHMSFADAAIALTFVNDNTNPEKYYGILSGLRYMNKINAFFAECDLPDTLTKGKIKDALNSDPKGYVATADKKLYGLLSQSSKNFINEDVGWIAYDEKWCFAGDLYKEWKELQDEYNEYKEKLWNAISKLDNINICTNRVSGIQVGNVNINQINNCIQKITTTTEIKTEIPDNNANNKTTTSNKTNNANTNNNNNNTNTNTTESNKLTNVNWSDFKVTARAWWNGAYELVYNKNNQKYVLGEDSCLYYSKDQNLENYTDIVRDPNNKIYDKPPPASFYFDSNNVPYYINEKRLGLPEPNELLSVNENGIGLLDNGAHCYFKDNELIDGLGFKVKDYRLIKTSKVTGEPEKAESSNTLIIVIIVIIIIIAAAGIGFFIWKSQQQSKPKTTQTPIQPKQ